MSIKRLFVIAALILIGCSSVPAQVDPLRVYPVLTTIDGKPASAASIPSDSIIEGTPVKNAPYSAEAINEIVMVLVDGNRIINKEVTKIFRDSEGRTRREIVAGNPKYVAPIDTTLPFRAEIRFESGIQISDPVFRYVYKLDPPTHTAKKYKMLSFVLPLKIPRDLVSNSDKKSSPVPEEYAVIKVNEAPGNSYSAGVESLGTRIIEGVNCEGKLITTTIPAGQIGNEKPIVITEESWYSPALKADILRRRFDPRSGESVYNLVNLIQSEPAASLFQVPSDYKLIDGSEEDKNTNRVLRPLSEPNPNPGSPVSSGKNSAEAASVCGDPAAGSSKATLTERIEDYYLSARCYQRTGQINDAVLIYAKAEILGRQIAGNATAAKARETLDQLYRELHNNSMLGIEKIYRKAEESLSQSGK